MKNGLTGMQATPVEVVRKRRPKPKTDRRRTTSGPTPTYAPRPEPPKHYVAKLTKVTLPSLRCLSHLDFSSRDWRPKGREA